MTADDQRLREHARRVLEHPEHKRGLEDVIFEVTTPVETVGPYERVRARILSSDPVDAAAWSIPNTAFRMRVPALTGDEPASRIYTVRSFDAAGSIVTFDVLRHPHDTPMMRWVADAGPGSTFPVTGPRAHLVITADRPSALLLGDESAVPAIHSILAAWPEGMTGRVFVQTADAGVVASLPSVDGVTVETLGGEPGDGTLAATAIRACAEEYDLTALTVWGGGERDEMRAIRDHLRGPRGMSRDSIRVFAYWKRGVAATQLDIDRLRFYGELIERGEPITDIDDLDVPVSS